MKNTNRTIRLAAGGLLAAATIGACTPPPGGGGSTSSTSTPTSALTERVSVSSDGSQGNGSSAGATAEPTAPAISADGRFVAFTSTSTNFAGDGNARDVFLRDRTTGTTTLVSAGLGGEYPAVSADGRYVGFTTSATTIVPGDTNATTDVFVWDRTNGTTERVSLANGGAQGNGPSGNVSAPSLSSDGRYVAFRSDATNLVAGDTNSKADVFVRDRVANVTTRVSVFSDGTQATGVSDYPSVSDNGRFVAFQSSGLLPGNLGNNVFVHDSSTAETTLISATATTGANSGPDGSAPSISSDGRYVAFHSARQLTSNDNDVNYYDVYVRDRSTGVTVRAPGGATGNYHAYYPDISSDGRYIAFETSEPLVSEDTNYGSGTDVYVWDRVGGSVNRSSVTTNGSQATGHSEQAAISATGRYVAFASFADDLVPNDTSPGDIFVRDCGA